MSRLPLTSCALLTLLIFSSSLAIAHPSHTSTTEIEWNAASKRFEVAMRLRIADIEDAVSLQQGSRFRLDSNSHRKPLLQEYLEQNFSVTLSESDDCRLHWVGCELELHDVWVYFEAESVPSNSSSDTSAHGSNVRVPKASSTSKLTWDDVFGPNAEHEPLTARTILNHDNVQIRHDVLMDVQPEQLNLVMLTIASKTKSLTFTQAPQHPQSILP